MTHHAKGQPPDPSLLTLVMALSGSMTFAVVAYQAAHRPVSAAHKAAGVALAVAQHVAWYIRTEINR